MGHRHPTAVNNEAQLFRGQKNEKRNGLERGRKTDEMQRDGRKC